MKPVLFQSIVAMGRHGRELPDSPVFQKQPEIWCIHQNQVQLLIKGYLKIRMKLFIAHRQVWENSVLGWNVSSVLPKLYGTDSILVTPPPFLGCDPSSSGSACAGSRGNGQFNGKRTKSFRKLLETAIGFYSMSTCKDMDMEWIFFFFILSYHGNFLLLWRKSIYHCV